jgi:Carbohydrate-selective porin, OprB family/S-layer homology domain
MFNKRMNKLSQGLLALGTIAIASPALADDLSYDNLDQLDQQIDPMAQVTSVNQLRDVSPTDWSYEALRSLVERYGCIAGYPDGTFRGNRALSRNEFAAGLNACMQQMERLIASSEAVLKEDIAKLQRLMKEFEAELAALGARVDNLEGRVAFLEDNQFSTTTKLYGEVAVTIADAFGDNVEAETVMNSRVRLQLSTTFTGKDTLITRLTSGNVGNSFTDEIGTQEGRLAYDGQSDNNLTIDRLHYQFPVTENIKATVMANLAGHWFYADTFNDGLEAGGGSRNVLTRFGERNPIYRLGGLGQGIGFQYKPKNSKFEASIGYLAPNGSDPNDEKGLFDGQFSAMAQVVFKPSKNFKLGFNYIHSYNPNGSFNLGGTGTNLANSIDGNTLDVESDAFGIQAKYDISPKLSLRAWGGYIDADVQAGNDAEIWTYALALAFPDLGKEGALGYILAGSAPYDGNNVTNETPFHVELAYRYPITDGIAITPGLIILTDPNQGVRGDAVYIGTIRTVFNF